MIIKYFYVAIYAATNQSLQNAQNVHKHLLQCHWNSSCAASCSKLAHYCFTNPMALIIAPHLS